MVYLSLCCALFASATGMNEMDLQFETTKLSTPWGYVCAVVLCVTTFGTIALTSGFFLKPDATFDDYLADVVPLFAGFISILGVSEIATRVTAARNGVKLMQHIFSCAIQLDRVPGSDK